jgi:DNA-binding response OmpR family regulator
MAANSILLVDDDDEIVRFALRDLLSHKGFAVTVAGNVV